MWVKKNWQLGKYSFDGGRSGELLVWHQTHFPPWRLLALVTFPRLPLLKLSFFALLAQPLQLLDNIEEHFQSDIDVIELMV